MLNIFDFEFETKKREMSLTTAKHFHVLLSLYGLIPFEFLNICNSKLVIFTQDWQTSVGPLRSTKKSEFAPKWLIDFFQKSGPVSFRFKDQFSGHKKENISTSKITPYVAMLSNLNSSFSSMLNLMQGAATAHQLASLFFIESVCYLGRA